MKEQNQKRKDILSLADIKQLVDTFYTRVRQDELLGPVFEEKIGSNWEKHLETMYRFWQTVLLDERTYQGSPGAKHITLPVGEEHFERWLGIFDKTVDELFTGEKAAEAKWRAARMAEMFAQKINYFKNNRGAIL
ncbi:group III truncated hemoglobin [Pontibacter qinzhouensis]|uniref:Group III truncated hemoglobin n=2 Tax=Pontibacter qinzhouensis TaxID=2603253 RepID=A0A5C8J5Q6_9BACT|nr:group III truncated hemoglobin [Pontibacter qinzhouensis]TXK32819.1 group III truncated hemoglobin [Pontibacter qinzhouensis]